MSEQRSIEVVADWVGLDGPTRMGLLTATPARGKEVFAFSYDEADPDYGHWLRMLIAPGGSLGGARPKASVRDERGQLWIAKFPSRGDDVDIGAWEMTTHRLAELAGVSVPEAQARRFGTQREPSRGHHTFLSRRFDRGPGGQRLHFATAMTLTDHVDGQGADEGASYLELVDLMARLGAQPAVDLAQLFRRIVFSICVSNTDDHLRNHGFMLSPTGWVLSPAYDINPNPHGAGLALNISETDNALDLDLALSVANVFRIQQRRAQQVVREVVTAVRTWRNAAGEAGLSATAQDGMQRAFRVADTWRDR